MPLLLHDQSHKTIYVGGSSFDLARRGQRLPFSPTNLALDELTSGGSEEPRRPKPPKGRALEASQSRERGPGDPGGNSQDNIAESLNLAF